MNVSCELYLRFQVIFKFSNVIDRHVYRKLKTLPLIVSTHFRETITFSTITSSHQQGLSLLRFCLLHQHAGMRITHRENVQKHRNLGIEKHISASSKRVWNLFSIYVVNGYYTSCEHYYRKRFSEISI